MATGWLSRSVTVIDAVVVSHAARSTRRARLLVRRWVSYCTPHLALGVGDTYTYCVPDKTKDGDPRFSEGCWGDDDSVMLTEEEFLDALRAASAESH